MRRYSLRWAALLLMLLPSSAFAAWHQASSDHFVIYADENPKDLREFATRLERYHSAMAVQTGFKVAKPSPSNRVTVYVVRNASDVRKLFGEGSNRFLGGFYTPRAGGSFAIIPRVDSGGAKASDSELVLFHEYAHHFMHGASNVAYPRWLSEGFAEFYATSSFEKDGSVGLGLPAHHRGAEMGLATDVPMSTLLDSRK